MELINNIKKRFRNWTYNLWVNIGNKYKWHRSHGTTQMSQNQRKQAQRQRQIQRQNQRKFQNKRRKRNKK